MTLSARESVCDAAHRRTNKCTKKLYNLRVVWYYILGIAKVYCFTIENLPYYMKLFALKGLTNF